MATDTSLLDQVTGVFHAKSVPRSPFQITCNRTVSPTCSVAEAGLTTRDDASGVRHESINAKSPVTRVAAVRSRATMLSTFSEYRRCRCDPPECSRLGSCSDRKSTRLNSSHSQISYAVFCLKKKKTNL